MKCQPILQIGSIIKIFGDTREWTIKELREKDFYATSSCGSALVFEYSDISDIYNDGKPNINNH